VSTPLFTVADSNFQGVFSIGTVNCGGGTPRVLRDPGPHGL
jgi:hypothetical protein